MPLPLFSTPLALQQDPRYRYVVRLCNYVFATLFLGMIMTLCGVMMWTYVENKKNQDSYDESKIKMARIFGVILLIVGSLFLLLSLIVLIVASIRYYALRRSPTESHVESAGQQQQQ